MVGKKTTGRTKQLSLKSTPEFHQRLKVLASKEKCLMIEILEQALELYEREKKERKKAINDSQRMIIDKATSLAKANKENTRNTVTPNPSRKRQLDDEIAEPNTGSKKRKIGY